MPRTRGNGSGSVTKIKGKKRNPYRVRVTVGCHYDAEKEKTVQKQKKHWLITIQVLMTYQIR